MLIVEKKNSYESRKDFFANEINFDRLKDKTEDIILTMTLPEILKMIRDISFDMVCYYSDDIKGVVYQGGYTEKNSEQACDIQRMLSTACDLFEQSIVKHREFDEDYLEPYINGKRLKVENDNYKWKLKNRGEYTEKEKIEKEMDKIIEKIKREKDYSDYANENEDIRELYLRWVNMK